MKVERITATFLGKSPSSFIPSFAELVELAVARASGAGSGAEISL